MSTSEFKIRAKSVLAKTYWMSFLASLIYVLIQGAVTTLTSRISSIGSGYDTTRFEAALENGNFERAMEELSKMQGATGAMSIVSWIISTCVTLFVLNVLIVGINKVYVNARKNLQVDIGDLFAPFKTYLPVVKTMFFHYLYIFLWSLLFIIPGIVKSYSYFMVPYILTENPNIETKRAFEISKTTMNGEKGNCFVLSLSFIGWYLLGVICCCIGIYFVQPYFEASKAEFYAYVKNKALTTGIATPADFGEAVA